ncbi:MAG: glycosyltransferase family 39 protein, partial [Anaerolineae bacterium]
MKLETAGLFLLALLPRLWGMRRLVTVDEAYWLRQTLLFWQALTARQWADAGITPEPGLTTLWGGGLGLWGYRLAVSTLSLTDWLALFRPLPVRLELLQAARLPLILLTCAGIGILYRLMRPCLGLPAARLAAGLLAFEPFFVAQSRLLTNEAPAALLALITLLTLWRAAQGSEWALVGAGVSAGLAVAADWTAVLLIPFAAAVFGVAGPKEGPLWRRLAGPVERFAFWLLLVGVVLVALWPAALLQPSNILRAVAGRPFGLGERQQALELLFRLAPVSMIGLALWPVYRSRLPGRTRAATHLLALFSAAFLLLIVVSGPRVEG